MLKKIVFVSDFFLDQVNGGAELTTNSILSDCPYQVERVLSKDLNLDIISDRKDQFWIFGNFSQVEDNIKIHFAKHLQYSVIEYDYKYCVYRNDDLHKKVTGECDCQDSTNGKINSIFISKAKIVWWMSEQQKEHYVGKFPFLGNINNKVLSSVFSKDNIQYFKSFQNKQIQKNNKWIIINSPSWVKDVKECVKYARDNKLEYDLVWGLSHQNLLEKLSVSKGLIFLPAGKDTCPRLVIEAKLLGCELVLNEKVQHKDESWFDNEETILSHLQTRTSYFWDEISNYV